MPFKVGSAFVNPLLPFCFLILDRKLFQNSISRALSCSSVLCLTSVRKLRMKFLSSGSGAMLSVNMYRISWSPVVVLWRANQQSLESSLVGLIYDELDHTLGAFEGISQVFIDYNKCSTLKFRCLGMVAEFLPLYLWSFWKVRCRIYLISDAVSY